MALLLRLPASRFSLPSPPPILRIRTNNLKPGITCYKPPMLFHGVNNLDNGGVNFFGDNDHNRKTKAVQKEYDNLPEDDDKKKIAVRPTRFLEKCLNHIFIGFLETLGSLIALGIVGALLGRYVVSPYVAQSWSLILRYKYIARWILAGGIVLRVLRKYFVR